MPKGYSSLSPEQKREIISRRKEKGERVADLAKEYGIQPRIIDTPNKVWVSDFTFLPYYGRFVYLATLEDIFTRQVVGWSASIRHNVDLVTQALLNALKHYPALQIAHFDQSLKYRSQTYLNLFSSLDIRPLMSQKASPWQNGHQESFYSGFKLELGHQECYLTLGELIEAMAQQIYYYNNHRIHTALKCPPAVFAQRIVFQQQRSLSLSLNPSNCQEIAERQSV